MLEDRLMVNVLLVVEEVLLSPCSASPEVILLVVLVLVSRISDAPSVEEVVVTRDIEVVAFELPFVVDELLLAIKLLDVSVYDAPIEVMVREASILL